MKEHDEFEALVGYLIRLMSDRSRNAFGAPLTVSLGSLQPLYVLNPYLVSSGVYILLYFIFSLCLD